MPEVVLPIGADMKALALRLAADVPGVEEAAAAVKGSEHLLTDAGFAAHVAHTLGAPCISPGAAVSVADSAEGAEAVIAQARLLGVEEAALVPLAAYRDACRLVAHTAAFQQGFLLAFIRREAVDRPLADRIGVPLENLEVSVNLLKLARLNSDGTPWMPGTDWR